MGEPVDGAETCVKTEMYEGETLAKRESLLMVLKPVLRLKCMKARPFSRVSTH